MINPQITMGIFLILTIGIGITVTRLNQDAAIKAEQKFKKKLIKDPPSHMILRMMEM